MKLLTKEKKGLFLEQGIFFWGKRQQASIFIMQMASSFYRGRGMERAHKTAYFFDVDQKITDGWLRLYFWERKKEQSG